MIQFFRNKNGNLSLLAALLAVPVIGSAGLAIDLGRAMQVRSNLRIAADSAALAALADLSAGVVWAGTKMSDSRVELSEDDARKFFRENAKVNMHVNISKAEIVVTKTGKDMTAAVTVPASRHRQ